MGDLFAMFEPTTVIALGAGLSAALLIIVIFGGGRDEKVRSRVGEISARRPGARTPVRPSAGEDATLRRRDAVGDPSDNALVRFFRNLELRLLRAGMAVSPTIYILISIALCLAITVVVASFTPLPLLFGLLAGIAAGVFIPHLWVSSAIAKRQRTFISQLPDAVDLIVRGVKAGLPVTETISVIGREMDDPVAEEFRDIAAQLSIGVSLDNALWAVAKRLGLQEFNFFCVSLSIQQETGGNLGELLENLSTMIRRREQLKLKIKAMSSEARASAMIIGSLPFVMGVIIYLVNPEYISVLFTDRRGWILLGMGLTSLFIGIAVMAKMVRFEI